MLKAKRAACIFVSQVLTLQRPTTDATVVLGHDSVQRHLQQLRQSTQHAAALVNQAHHGPICLGSASDAMRGQVLAQLFQLLGRLDRWRM